MAKKPVFDVNHPIAVAVMPLREEAARRAALRAIEIVDSVKKELAAADFDVSKAAPYPRAWKSSIRDYHLAVSKYKLFSSLTKWRKTTYGMNEPHYADVTDELANKFVEEAREDARLQYDAFICKLVGKCGAVKSAVLEGDHIWGRSHLTVTKETDAVEIWRTKMIINVSKLGRLFNQYPSRIVKGKD